MTARSPPAARMTGALLSALLYECSNAKADLEGFLTGSVATRKTQRMDDNSDTTVEIEEDFIGCLLLPILNDIFAVVPPETIVGYFRFRRQTLLVPSLRETTVYRTLCDHLDARRRMCCAVFRFSAKPPRATHTYAGYFPFCERSPSHHFARQLEKLAVTLVNMMESTAEYRSFISNLAPDMPYRYAFLLPFCADIILDARMLVHSYPDLTTIPSSQPNYSNLPPAHGDRHTTRTGRRAVRPHVRVLHVCAQ
ncbi:hypothetical protein BC938DRAFT_473575, partial [Jimgerdemannia flammicorona]